MSADRFAVNQITHVDDAPGSGLPYLIATISGATPPICNGFQVNNVTQSSNHNGMEWFDTRADAKAAHPTGSPWVVLPAGE